MPDLAYHATLENRLTLHERSMLLAMLTLVNEIRTQAGLPPLTREDLTQRFAQALRDEMRAS